MKTKTKAIIVGVGVTIAVGVGLNAASAGAPPAQPFRQPTPIPAKPHSLVQPSGLSMEPDTIGWAGIGWPVTRCGSCHGV